MWLSAQLTLIHPWGKEWARSEVSGDLAPHTGTGAGVEIGHAVYTRPAF